MTFMAQFNYERRPYLMADTLITRKARNEILPITLPTKLAQEEIIKLGSRTPTSLVQKIHILSDTLALSWCGSFIKAKCILKEIAHNTDDIGTVNSVIEKFHKELDGDIDLSLILLSLDGSEMSVRSWNIEFTEIPPFGEINYAGSGQGDIVGFIGGFGSDLPAQPPIAHLTKPEVSHATILSLFLSAFGVHFLSGWGLRNAWGGALELMFTNGLRFQKLDDVLLVFWNTYYESETSVRFGFGKAILKVKYIADLMIVRVVEFDRPDSPSRGRVFVIPPLVQLSERPKQLRTEDVPWQSNSVFHFVRTNDDPKLGMMSLLDNWDEFCSHCSIVESGKSVRLKYDSVFVKRVLDHMGYKDLNSFEDLRKR